MAVTKSSWLVEQPIAHREFHSGDGECPENSLLAFERAADRRFAIELDVHILSDPNVVVFHDGNTNRMTGIDGQLTTLDSGQIKRMRLKDSEQRIPLLKEVLDLVRGCVPLLIEIKSIRKVGRLEKSLVRTLKDYSGPFAVQSFDPYSLKWWRLNAGPVERGQLSGDFRHGKLPPHKGLLRRHLLMNWVSRPTFISYDIRCMPNWATSRQRKKGLPILGWTARSLEEYEGALRWCDNVLFEGFDPIKGAEARTMGRALR